MQELGSRIKEIRKERKMTLAQVAGDRLTKGMLSLIENGKAQPSMESLQFIAEQLQIDVSELLHSPDTINFKDVLMEAEDLTKQLSECYDLEKEQLLRQNIMDLIQPYIEDGSLKGITYEEARLFEMYLIAKYYVKDDSDTKDFYRLVDMYESVHAFTRILNPFSIMGAIEFQKQKYHEAVCFLIEGEHYIKKYDYLIPDMEKLDLYYNLTVMYAAINDDVKTEHYLNLALQISKEKKIYYRLHDFYRFLYFIHLQKGDAENCRYYLKKIEAYLVIMEDPFEDLTYLILKLAYINLIEQDYQKTLATKYEGKEIPADVMKMANVFLHSEYGYALINLGKFEEALSLLEDLFIPNQNKHPIDLANIYRAFAVRAMCHFNLGHIEEAKRDILYAHDGVKEFSETLFKQFIDQSYEKIMS